MSFAVVYGEAFIALLLKRNGIAARKLSLYIQGGTKGVKIPAYRKKRFFGHFYYEKY